MLALLTSLALATLSLANFTPFSSTPLTQCGTATITWPATTGPYELVAQTVACGGLPSGTYFGSTEETSAEWIVAEPAGTTVYFQLMDATGCTGTGFCEGYMYYTQPYVVNASTDTSCLP